MREMTNPLPVPTWSPSALVGLNVKRLRKRRGWSQQQLVDRLNEILTDTPPWTVELYEARKRDPSRPKDSRERRPRNPKTQPSVWTQSKIARLESGKLQKVRLEEAFELALALDVSPLFLFADGKDEDGVPLRIRLSPSNFAWPRELRSWIRGARPILGSTAYRTDADAMAGIHFYAVESQPGESRVSSELQQDAKKGEELRRKWRPLSELLEKEETEEEQAAGG
jgi:transcriptional regulator with XRE-family HTH domain